MGETISTTSAAQVTQVPPQSLMILWDPAD